MVEIPEIRGAIRSAKPDVRIRYRYSHFGSDGKVTSERQSGGDTRAENEI